jgi:hypothetical protein
VATPPPYLNHEDFVMFFKGHTKQKKTVEDLAREKAAEEQYQRNQKAMELRWHKHYKEEKERRLAMKPTDNKLREVAGVPLSTAVMDYMSSSGAHSKYTGVINSVDKAHGFGKCHDLWGGLEYSGIFDNGIMSGVFLVAYKDGGLHSLELHIPGHRDRKCDAHRSIPVYQVEREIKAIKGGYLAHQEYFETMTDLFATLHDEDRREMERSVAEASREVDRQKAIAEAEREKRSMLAYIEQQQSKLNAARNACAPDYTRYPDDPWGGAGNNSASVKHYEDKVERLEMEFSKRFGI